MYSEMKKEKSVLLRQVVSTYACGELDETQQLAQSVVADGIECVIESVDWLVDVSSVLVFRPGVVAKLRDEVFRSACDVYAKCLEFVDTGFYRTVPFL